MIPPSPQKSGRPPSSEHPRFLKSARQVLESVGAEFFSTLVKELREALDSECVYIGEFTRGEIERVQTVAACVKEEWVSVFELPLAGGPDAELALGKPCTFERGVTEIFPEDRLLSDLQVEAYVGVPLNDAEGKACGVLAALFCEPLDVEIYLIQSMLNVFVPRASAELNRKRADDALRESEQRYRAFVQMNPDACWRVDFDQPIETSLPDEEEVAMILQSGRVAECNDALVQRLGFEQGYQLIGARITDAVLSLENARNSLLTLIRSGYHHSTIEVTAVDRRGKRGHYVHSHWGIVENGRLLRIWGSSRDVTELRELEAGFQRAQKLKSVGRLAAGVAHDFNNLLTVIQGYTSELLSRTKSTDNAYIGLTEIQKAAVKGAALINQLRPLSRQQSAKMQLLDLNPIVKDDEVMLRHLLGRNFEIVTELGPPALVRADAGSIHQVLLNLVVNARDAMPEGGRLTIGVANVDIGENRPPELAAVEPGQYVRLSVADNGIGMTPEIEAHLFEPFFTTKSAAQGTGLGLSTVYGIVRQSGGYITVQTAPNNGTTIEIFLPREPS